MMPADDLFSWALAIAFAAIAISQLLAMFRLVIGPGTADRILLELRTIGICWSRIRS